MDFSPVGRRLRTAVLAHPFLVQISVLGGLDLAIHWTLLTQFHGYLAWGNFNTPYTSTQIPSGPVLFWNPYQYNGTLVGLPFSALSNYIESQGPLSALIPVAGVNGAAKVYAVLSTLFLGATALLLARTMIRRPVAQLAAAVFVLAGPVQLVLYGQGDYQEFVVEGLVFLSLFTLWLAVHRPSQRWAWLPISAWLVVLTFQVLQAFLLDLVLIACLLPLYLREWRDATGRTRPSPTYVGTMGLAYLRGWVGHAWGRFVQGTRPGGYLRDLGAVLVRAPAWLAVAAVILVPTYVTFYVMGSGATGASSNVALSVTTFTAYSRNPQNILGLNGYFDFGPHMVQSGAGGTLALAVWLAALWGLLALLWLGYLWTHDRRVVYLLIVTVITALIGAGPSGPLASVTVALYLQFPGYAALNTSYYWGWFLIAPLDALMLGIVLEGRMRPRPPGETVAPRRTPPERRPQLSAVYDQLRTVRERPRAMRWVAVGVVLLLGITILVPLANGAYYTSPNGIHEVIYPSEYAQIPGLLQALIGHSYAGVALFNPDVGWFQANSTQSVPNAFFLYPTVRTPGLPFYLAPALQSNAYFFWLYEQFYSNTTRYAAQLFALAGVEYFLVFYGTQSASFYNNFLPFSEGKNASQLLQYQQDVSPVVLAQSFAIYRNLAYNGVALDDANLSLVAGPGYDELNALAYAGIGLENQSWVFPSDLPANGCATELGRVDRVYTASLNALIGVAVACDHISVASPVPETVPAGNPRQTWVPSTSTLDVPVVQSWPTTLAVTEGNPTSIQVPVSGGNCTGNCRIWLPIRCSGDGGTLTFGWDGATWSVSTVSGSAGANNTMVWISLPFAVAASGTLSITGSRGWNAVGSVYVFSDGVGAPVPSPVAWLNETLRGIPIYDVTPASQVNISPVDSRLGRLGYFAFSGPGLSNSVPGNQGVVASVAGTIPQLMRLPIVKPAGPGWLALLVRAASYGYLSVDLEGSPAPMLIGFNPGNYGTVNNNWKTILIPWNDSAPDLGATVGLTLLGGTLWLSAAWFLPEMVPGSLTPAPVVRPDFGNASLYAENTTSVTRWNAQSSPSGYLTINIDGTFPPSTTLGHFLLSVNFPNLTLPATAIALSVNVTPGVWISANGAAVSYSSNGSFTQFAPQFLNSQVGPPGLVFDVESYGSFPAAGNAFALSARFAFVSLPGPWNVTDLAPGPPLEVSADTSGYQVATNGSSLILLRVAEYAGMDPGPGASLTPALGSLDTLVWNPHNESRISVTPNSIGSFYLGVDLSLLATAVWVAVELVVRWRRARPSRSTQELS
jgi:hypothetical protein